MFLTLKQLHILGFVTTTRTGELVISCDALFVLNATYAGKSYKVNKVDGGTKEIRISLSSVYKGIAIEQLCEQSVDLVVEINPEKSMNEDVKTMAGLVSAPVPTKYMNPAPTRHAVPAPVFENGILTATVCVASQYAMNLPESAADIFSMGRAMIAQVSINPNDVADQGNGCYCLSLPDGRELYFTFHRDIAKDAEGLLQKARDDADAAEGHANIQQILQKCKDVMNRDSRPGANSNMHRVEPDTSANVIPYNPFNGQGIASPVPMFEFGDGVSSGDWNKDADDAAASLLHTSASAPALAPPVAPAPLSRNVVATAFSGALDTVLSRDEQKALKKTTRATKKAQLEAQRLENEAEEAMRLQDLADIARVDQGRKEADAKARHDALVTITVQPVVQEEEKEENPAQIWGHTARLDVVQNLQHLAQQCGCSLQVIERDYQKGPMYFIDLTYMLTKGYLGMKTSAHGNELIVGQSSNDGTFLWGTCVNVHNGSYAAVATMFPEMDDMVQHVMETRAALKIQKPHQRQYQHPQQGLLPIPGLVCVMPVCDTWGRIVAYQQAPQFA